MAQSIIDEAHRIHQTENKADETGKFRGKIEGVEEQVDALAEHLSKIPKNVSPTPIYAQMERLQNIKEQLEKELMDLSVSQTYREIPASLNDYQTYLSLIKRWVNQIKSPEEQTKIVKKLVEKVEVLPGEFIVHYKVGRNEFLRGPHGEELLPTTLNHPLTVYTRGGFPHSLDPVSEETFAFTTTIRFGSSPCFPLTHVKTISVRWADDPGSPPSCVGRFLLRQFHTQGHPSNAAGGFLGGDRDLPRFLNTDSCKELSVVCIVRSSRLLWFKVVCAS